MHGLNLRKLRTDENVFFDISLHGIRADYFVQETHGSFGHNFWRLFCPVEFGGLVPSVLLVVNPCHWHCTLHLMLSPGAIAFTLLGGSGGGREGGRGGGGFSVSYRKALSQTYLHQLLSHSRLLKGCQFSRGRSSAIRFCWRFQRPRCVCMTERNGLDENRWLLQGISEQRK